MATIRKRGRSWHAQVRRTGFPPLTASFRSKADAIVWARGHEQQIDRGLAPLSMSQGENLTLADLLNRYEAIISVAKRGADRETFKIRVLMRSAMANVPAHRITGSMVAAYRDLRLSAVRPATVRRELALLRHCLEVARREWGVPINPNPMSDVKLPAMAFSRDRRLEPDDVFRLRLALTGSKVWYLAPIVELALETGMRRGELLSLTWSNLDLARRLASLPMTKNGRRRDVPLSGKAVEVLARLPLTDDRIFPLRPGTVGIAWKRLVAKAGVDNLRFHDLRHEAISRFFEMGLSLPEVALISGHQDYRMLLRYTHIRPVDVAKKLAERA